MESIDQRKVLGSPAVINLCMVESDNELRNLGCWLQRLDWQLPDCTVIYGCMNTRPMEAQFNPYNTRTCQPWKDFGTF